MAAVILVSLVVALGALTVLAPRVRPRRETA